MKDLLSIRELSKEQIETFLIETAREKPKVMDKSLRKNDLKGSITTLFYENSTRTKLSFWLAAKYLGMYSDDLAVSTSSVTKDETLIDTGETIDSMGTDFIILRSGKAGASHLLARHVKSHVINAGDGTNEHPSQAILDMFTMRETKGQLEGLKIVIAGDIKNSRVARSNIFGLIKMGADVVLAGPPTMIETIDGVYSTANMKEAIKDADIIMGLRIQLERQALAVPSLDEYTKFFSIDEEILSYAKKDVLVMHPGPVNRGIELSTCIIDSERSLILDQVENGVAARMAVLKILAENR
jgi:aspartate carbamoyltransferase catalytic subunit